MRFYQGLTREIRIGDTTKPPILILRDGVWIFNEDISLRDSLVKPFISDHLNEALNPSIFTKNLGVRSYVRRTVRRRSCEKWFDQYPGLSQAGLEEASRALRLWHGEDYGFTDSEHFVTIANTCFQDESIAEGELPGNRNKRGSGKMFNQIFGSWFSASEVSQKRHEVELTWLNWREKRPKVKLISNRRDRSVVSSAGMK